MAAIQEALVGARNRDFSVTLYTEYLGDPPVLAGANVTMEVRLYGGAAGDYLIADTNVSTIDVATGRSEIDPDDDVLKAVRQLVLEPSIPQAAMETLPGLHQPEAGAAQRFEYEIMLTYADDARDSLWIGDLIVYPGVVE